MPLPRRVAFAAMLGLIPLGLPVVALADDGLPQFRVLAPSADAVPLDQQGRWTFSAMPFIGFTDMTNDDPDISATWTLDGGSASLGYAFDPGNRLTLKAGYGETAIDYQLLSQTLNERSYAIGLQYETVYRLLHIGLGGSWAHDTFTSQLPNDRDDWAGNEKEIHLSANIPQKVIGEFWATPLLGLHLLELSQDQHSLGADIFPKEDRWSRMLYGGVNFEVFNDDMTPGHMFKPWAFVGFTYDNSRDPPQGPSVFASDEMAGNHFTVTSRLTPGVPSAFASGLTGIFSGGISVEITDRLAILGFYYHDLNQDYASDFVGFGLRLKI